MVAPLPSIMNLAASAAGTAASTTASTAGGRAFSKALDDAQGGTRREPVREPVREPAREPVRDRMPEPKRDPHREPTREPARPSSPEPQRPPRSDSPPSDRPASPPRGRERELPPSRAAAPSRDASAPHRASASDGARDPSQDDAHNADAPAEGGDAQTPDPGAWIAGWPASALADAATATSPDTAPAAALDGAASKIDARAFAGRGRGPHDAAGGAWRGLQGIDRALAGPAGGTAASDDLAAVRAAHDQAALGASATAAFPAADAVAAIASSSSPTTGAHGAGLHALATAAPAHIAGPAHSADRAAPVATTLHAAVDSPEFAPALGTTLSLLARDGVQQAQLNLNPAELGPVAVQIALDGAQARIDFHASHAATRAALEASLPELAAALRDSGLTLAGGGVFDQPRPRHSETSFTDGDKGPREGESVDDDLAPARLQVARPRGVVDLIA